MCGQLQSPLSCLVGACLFVQGADYRPLFIVEKRYINGAGEMVIFVFEWGPDIHHQVGIKQVFVKPNGFRQSLLLKISAFIDQRDVIATDIPTA
jgi:hypothetical protein